MILHKTSILVAGLAVCASCQKKPQRAPAPFQGPDAEFDAAHVGASASAPPPPTSGPSSPPAAHSSVLTGTEFVGPRCVRREDGTVWCWGNQEWDGFNQAETALTPPHEVVELRDVVQMVGWHLLKRDGTVWMWGVARSQEMDGKKVFRDARPPQKIEGIDEAVQMVGESVPCVLRRSGDVRCWAEGYDMDHDEHVTTGYFKTRPFTVAGLSDAVDIALGGIGTCVRRSNDVISCWSGDDEKIRKRPGVEAHDMPLKIPGLKKLALCSNSGFTGCGLLADGHVSCWGDISVVGPSKPDKALWQVKEIEHAVDVACWEYSAFALTADGSLWTWGGSSMFPIPPTVLTRMSGVRALVAGSGVNLPLCVIYKNSEVGCWSEAGSRRYGHGGPPSERATEPILLGVPPSHRVDNP